MLWVMVANLIKIWGKIFRFALADPHPKLGHMQSCTLLQIYGIPIFFPA